MISALSWRHHGLWSHGLKTVVQVGKGRQMLMSAVGVGSIGILSAITTLYNRVTKNTFSVCETARKCGGEAFRKTVGISPWSGTVASVQCPIGGARIKRNLQYVGRLRRKVDCIARSNGVSRRPRCRDFRLEGEWDDWEGRERMCQLSYSLLSLWVCEQDISSPCYSLPLGSAARL
ncbi:hypothetical protein CC78DRAFT_97219 [Lojkania enalia]|uniref:Uncharacterized protein n=1 Tax=Lojkania enalia TaxID=147567 RepID=A0A9P4JZV5_9PLEO|nr:hypothetical protein CC78DRAFT_97219 [Didymosphaeria enalia]